MLSSKHSWDSSKTMQLHFGFYVERLFQAKGVQNLDSMVFMGSFQLRIFTDSMKSIWITAFFKTNLSFSKRELQSIFNHMILYPQDIIIHAYE